MNIRFANLSLLESAERLKAHAEANKHTDDLMNPDHPRHAETLALWLLELYYSRQAIENSRLAMALADRTVEALKNAL